MKVTKAISRVDSVLWCVCLQWATVDELDRTLDIDLYMRDKNIKSREYYSLLPFSVVQKWSNNTERKGHSVRKLMRTKCSLEWLKGGWTQTGTLEALLFQAVARVRHRLCGIHNGAWARVLGKAKTINTVVQFWGAVCRLCLRCERVSVVDQLVTSCLRFSKLVVEVFATRSLTIFSEGLLHRRQS